VITIRVSRAYQGKHLSPSVYKAEMYAAAVAQVPLNYEIHSFNWEHYPVPGGALKAAEFTFVEARA
jgi:hypothetical protein